MNTNPPNSTVIAARVPTHVANELRQHAEHQGLTMSQIIGASVRRALRLDLASRTEETGA